MQEIKKRRIVIASVLKPVNDPRMFEKLGQSLSTKYEVHILGTKGTTNTSDDSIFFHPLSSYSRISITRILTPLKILGKIIRLKPALVIVSTHELLWMVLVVKIFLGSKVIYDIRENYFRNILYTNSFPPILRVFIALYVRIKEWITSPVIDSFFLAEAGYARELNFLGDKKVILENKVKRVVLPRKEKWRDGDHNIHLLFSGTLAATTGVLIAIDLAIKLHAQDPRIRLHIVGFAPLVSVQREIQDLVDGKDFIKFRESHEPIPHTEILDAIASADVGVICYPPNLSTENTIPTKLFEYLGYALPVLLINHLPWVEFCRPYDAAVAFNPDAIDPADIIRKITQSTFYTKVPEAVFWESEEEKLLHTVSGLLK